MIQSSIFKNGGKTLAGILVFAILPWLPVDLMAQEPTDIKTVTSSGYSRIYGNISDARQAAIAESIRFAVQEAASALLTEDQAADHFEAISRALYRNPNRFIQDYRIIRDMQVNRSYQVLVRATVLMDEVQKALSAAGLQTKPTELPTLLFMVAERPLDDIGYQYWWHHGIGRHAADTTSPAMAAVMMEQGFKVIDKRLVLSNLRPFHAGLDLSATPADYEAAIFARRTGAHLVVLGTAEAARGPNRLGDDRQTYKGNVDLRVINTRTGEQLTTVRQQAISIGADPGAASANAVADAAYQAARRLADRIDELWRPTQEPTGGMTLSVSGPDILPHLEQFRRTIAGLRDVSAVRTMQLSTDAARLWVDFKGTPDELVDTLLKQSYGPFGINIAETAPDHLEIEFIRDLTTEMLTE